MKPKLWKRYLACGHYRYTNLPYIAGDFKKPKIGENCYCRECMVESIVTKVEEADKIQYTAVKVFDDAFKKMAKRKKEK